MHHVTSCDALGMGLSWDSCRRRSVWAKAPSSPLCHNVIWLWQVAHGYTLSTQNILKSISWKNPERQWALWLSSIRYSLPFPNKWWQERRGGGAHPFGVQISARGGGARNNFNVGISSPWVVWETNRLKVRKGEGWEMFVPAALELCMNYCHLFICQFLFPYCMFTFIVTVFTRMNRKHEEIK